MAAVVPAILRARNSSQARDPTHRPPFAALTSLKTKSCMEVVQATKLRVIFARDLEQAGKLVDGQWYSLSKPRQKPFFLAHGRCI
ncbi:hypothetical protein V5799_010438 [Amblyomma americanum]|uniref:Uncharacterized protein n=1 Tax=Amblyomma americanum TaxID=6943 RepID=A0AAQ4EJN5_AMBAM